MPAVFGPTAAFSASSVDVALGVDRDLAHHAAAHRRGRRVGAVRGLGHDDLVARQIAARAVVGADHRDAGELAVRAGHRARAHTPCMPVTSFSISCSSYMQARKPWPCDSGASGWRAEELRQHRVLVARLAGCTSSCTSRADRSACRCEKFSCDRRVKWRTASSSPTSGSSGGCARRSCCGQSASAAVPARAATGRVAPRPGWEYSKITFSRGWTSSDPRRPQAARAACSDSPSAAT